MFQFVIFFSLFLSIFSSIQGLGNAGPSKHHTVLNTLSHAGTPTIGYSTLRPPTVDPLWGDKVLKKDKGYSWYCMLDPHTAQGQQDVAEYNQFGEEWKRVLKEDLKDTSHMGHRYNKLLQLYARSYLTRLHTLHMREGLHRQATVIQGFTCSHLDDSTGKLFGWADLRLEDFVQEGLVPTDSSIETSHIYERWTDLSNKKVIDPFFHGTTVIDVIYLKDSEVSVDEVLNAERVISEQTSRNKLTSATKSTPSKIGILVGNYIKSMSDESLNYDPNFIQDSTFAWPKGFPPRGKPKTDGSDIMGDYPYPSVPALHEDVFLNYCKNPMNEEYSRAMNEKLTVPCRSKSRRNINMAGPPFIVSYKSISADAYALSQEGTPTPYMTTHQANMTVLAPLIIHLLMGDIQNKTPTQMAENDDAKMACQYFVRHHIHEVGLSNLRPHTSLDQHYKLEKATNSTIIEGTQEVLGATIFICDLVNVTLTTIARLKKDQPGVRRKRLNEACHKLSEIFCTIDSYCNSPSTSDFVTALGECSASLHLNKMFH